MWYDFLGRFVGKAASTAREGKDVHFQFNNVYLLSLFNDEFLDKPMTPQERFRAAQQIQSKWSNIGRILGPEPFEPFEIYAFGERRSDNDGALQMLDAWANKFDTRATRRHFINAIKNPEIGCSTEVAAIFSGKLFVVFLRLLIPSFRPTLTLCLSESPLVHIVYRMAAL